MQLTNRERFNRTLRFEPVDRCPIWHVGEWAETLTRWHREGLPVDVSDVVAYLGFDYRGNMDMNVELDPPFETEVLEEDEHTIVQRRGDGAVVRAFKKGHGKSMPQWLDWPVRTRDDWEALKERLRPDTPGRVAAGIEELRGEWASRDYPLMLRAGSFYGVLRQWIGVEQLSVLFYDDPAWIHDMMAHLADLYVGIIERILPYCDPAPDFAGFWEDMCYKTGPLIGPDLFREFMIPNYRKVTELLRARGIDAIFVDSDGNIEKLIPHWLEGGVNGFHPLEVASGMDPVALRKQYGQDIVLRGGIDKRLVARGGEAMRAEVLAKVPFLAKSGGYIPYVDHDVPPDVSWANFTDYAELLRQAAAMRE